MLRNLILKQPENVEYVKEKKQRPLKMGLRGVKNKINTQLIIEELPKTV